MDEKSVFYVQGDDQRRFRMVIRGDVGKVTGGMIRKFLRPQGITEDYDLLFNGVLVLDDMKGKELGLVKGSVLQLIRSEKNTKDSKASGGRHLHASGQGGEQPLPAPSNPSFSPTDAHGGKISFESENRRRREEVHRPGEGLQLVGNKEAPSRFSTTSSPDTTRSLPVSRKSPPTHSGDFIYERAAESIRLLGEALHLTDPPLQLGHDLTCSLGPPDMTIFITLDPSTERLYLYSPLLSALPDDEELRTKLYEVLLQGSLCSREVCGGGIGISLESNLVMLSTSLPVRYCVPEALKEVVPQLVTSLSRWRSVLDELFAV